MLLPGLLLQCHDSYVIQKGYEALQNENGWFKYVLGG